MIRDLYTGNEATRLMALIMLVISVSPMLAPLIGSLVIEMASWRVIFGISCLTAVFSVFLTRFALSEILPPERRVPVNARTLRLMDRLDEITLAHGGRLYLAKDSRMTQRTFEQSYGDAGRRVTAASGPDETPGANTPGTRFQSLQSRRLGL